MTPAPLTLLRRRRGPAEIDLDRAIMDAVKAVANLSPTEMSNHAGPHDAESLITDIMEAAEIADDLIGALVAYAAWHFDGIKEGEFRTVCRDAVEDNVVATLQRIAERLRDAARSDGGRHDFQRSVRA